MYLVCTCIGVCGRFCKVVCSFLFSILHRCALGCCNTNAVAFGIVGAVVISRSYGQGGFSDRVGCCSSANIGSDAGGSDGDGAYISAVVCIANGVVIGV